MKSENYIVINGKRADLTEEQLKALGIKVPKDKPFEKVGKRTPFYYITNKGNVEYGVEVADFHCDGLHKVANYCTDKSLMEQRALHEVLYRLLWRYSMEHDGDKIDLNHSYSINHRNGAYDVYEAWGQRVGAVAFYTITIARNAITEVIKPFMEAHPEFKW